MPGKSHLRAIVRTRIELYLLTAGAGTNIFPIRIGTQSNWDLLKITFKKLVNFLYSRIYKSFTARAVNSLNSNILFV